MSLRAEYSWTLEHKPEVGWSLWVTWIHSHHPVKGMIMPKGLVESDDWLEVCEREATRLIATHMEKVTRILEQGPPVVAHRSQFDPREDPTEHE